MQDLPLIISGVLALAVIFLVVFLICQVLRLASQNQNVVLNLLTDQVTENQALRNQLRAPDLQTLNGLNTQTLPSHKQPKLEGSDPIDLTDLGEAINYEEQLAMNNYQIGDIGDLASQGWPQPVVRREHDGLTAYDAT